LLILFSSCNRDGHLLPKGTCHNEIDPFVSDIDMNRVNEFQVLVDSLEANPDLVPDRLLEFTSPNRTILHCKWSYQGFLIYNQYHSYHLSGGALWRVSTDGRPDNIDINTSATISVKEARKIARKAQEFDTRCLDYAYMIYEANASSGIDETDYRMVYRFTNKDGDAKEVIVDAHSGEVISSWDGIYY